MVSIDTLTSKIWNSSETDIFTLQEEAFNLRVNNFGKDLWCYSPSMIHYGIDQYQKQDRNKFFSLSVTGTTCALKCDHCQGKLLESMHPAKTSQELIQSALNFKEKGCENLLISGGATRDGMVPLFEHVDAIRTIKEDLNMKIFLHTGLITEELIKELVDINIDSIMFDVIGDDETIKEVYHLNKSVSDFKKALQLLNKHKIPFTPHIILGLNHGKIKGEFNALKIIANVNPNALVLVILKPFEGTLMSNVTPLPIEIARKFFILSRLVLPKIPITLGCARPIGEYRVESDIQAIDSGINAIAFLSQDGADHAEKRGLTLRFLDTCCAEIYSRV